MHYPECADHPFVLQVKVEGFELRRGQHALVDEGSSGKAWEVDGFASRAVLTGALGAQFVLGTLADHVRPALQFHSGGAADEWLTEGRHRIAGQGAERGVIGGHVAPTEQGQAFSGHNCFECLAGRGGVPGGLRQECDAGGVGALGGQLEVHHRAQEPIRYADHDPGPVTTIGLGTGRAAMLEVQQGGDRLVDNVPAAPAVHVHDHGHTTCIMFVRGVVEPDTIWHAHLTLHNISRGDSATAPCPAGDPPCVGERRAFCGLQQVG